MSKSNVAAAVAVAVAAAVDGSVVALLNIAAAAVAVADVTFIMFVCKWSSRYVSPADARQQTVGSTSSGSQLLAIDAAELLRYYVNPKQRPKLKPKPSPSPSPSPSSSPSSSPHPSTVAIIRCLSMLVLVFCLFHADLAPFSPSPLLPLSHLLVANFNA